MHYRPVKSELELHSVLAGDPDPELPENDVQVPRKKVGPSADTYEEKPNEATLTDEIEQAYFYHYERAQAEQDHAQQCEGRVAELHRELAALHLARKQHLDFVERLARRRLTTRPVRIDKEC
jgi:hypothetical protein